MTASANLFAGTAPFGQATSPRFEELSARIDRLIAGIDAALTRQLNAILHAPEFQELEALWRGLEHLVDQAGVGLGVIVRVLDVDWNTLGRSLERAHDYDQSTLFQMVYDGEFGMPGGQPFGLIVGGYSVSAQTQKGSADQIEVMRRLAAVGSAAFCPIIMEFAPQGLGYDYFHEVAAHDNLTPTAQSDPALIRWNGMRRSDDMRFVGLVGGGIVARALYRRYDRHRVDGFPFDEDCVPLFCNGAFAFASTVMTAFQSSGWFAAIRGAYQDEPGAGRVENFAAYDFATDLHGLSAQTPIEFRPTALQEDAMISLGVIPLSALHLDSGAVFNANPSLHRPQAYQDPIATQNARLASMLQYVLCTSRFAHYLKVITRDEIGSTAEAQDIQDRLTRWLMDYSLGNDDASSDLKARYPLRDAGVEVQPVPGKPGTYACTIRLQPHFQLDDISTSFHLITETSSALTPDNSTERKSA